MFEIDPKLKKWIVLIKKNFEMKLIGKYTV